MTIHNIKTICKLQVTGADFLLSDLRGMGFRPWSHSLGCVTGGGVHCPDGSGSRNLAPVTKDKQTAIANSKIESK